MAKKDKVLNRAATLKAIHAAAAEQSAKIELSDKVSNEGLVTIAKGMGAKPVYDLPPLNPEDMEVTFGEYNGFATLQVKPQGAFRGFSGGKNKVKYLLTALEHPVNGPRIRAFAEGTYTGEEENTEE